MIKSGHFLKYIYKKNLGTAWVRGVLHWTIYVVYYQPQKEYPNWTVLTVGGNLIVYPGYVSTPTFIVWNNVVSIPNYKYMCIDIIFYLGTQLTRYKYIYMYITLIPYNIIQKYNLLLLVINGFIYLEICKVMYGFPQVGRLTNNLLTKSMFTKGYFWFIHTPGLWIHKCHPISFPWW